MVGTTTIQLKGKGAVILNHRNSHFDWRTTSARLMLKPCHPASPGDYRGVPPYLDGPVVRVQQELRQRYNLGVRSQPSNSAPAQAAGRGPRHAPQERRLQQHRQVMQPLGALESGEPTEKPNTKRTGNAAFHETLDHAKYPSN